jgi:hypothetical protein
MLMISVNSIFRSFQLRPGKLWVVALSLIGVTHRSHPIAILSSTLLGVLTD